MYALGYDIGSSRIKVALIKLDSGLVIDAAFAPEQEMTIMAPQVGWAEQHPELWWKTVCNLTKQVLQKTAMDPAQIKSIGIAYQMHGLVLIDKNLKVLRPSIIWCDSRAVDIGDNALIGLGQEYCYNHMLNSPGNFTASKLKWVKDHEPEIFDKTYKALLPGDYIAMKLTGEVNTTKSGLSEAIIWDFKADKLATKLLDYYGIPENMIPEIVDTFSVQGKVSQQASLDTGLKTGTPICYRAGDQPNNAMSLNVLNPGEIAATGGTSGVVYGISDHIIADKNSRINAFAHVNHTSKEPRIGQLLCINGAGSQYAWIKKEMGQEHENYTNMETMVQHIPIGSDGLRILPFGNGAERMLNNLQTGAHFSNIHFNIHTRAHFFRAALEGIAFSFVYGILNMAHLGIIPKRIRVGNDNLFQSTTFAMTISNLLNCTIEMMDTTGAIGAAKASRIAIEQFSKPEEAIESTPIVKTYTPENQNDQYIDAFQNWKISLDQIISQTSSTH